MKFTRPLTLAVLAIGMYGAAVASAKKPADSGTAKQPAGGSNADAAKAEITATIVIATLKISRLALAVDAGLTEVKDTVGAIYDRQETATKAGLDKLRAASGDKAKVAAAVADINAADDESVQYFTAHSDVKDKVSKRAKILNAEIGQIARTPDAYVSMLAKAGLTGAPFTQARTMVKEASQKAGGHTDGDSAETIHTALVQVRKLLTPKQIAALDGLLGGK